MELSKIKKAAIATFLYSALNPPEANGGILGEARAVLGDDMTDHSWRLSLVSLIYNLATSERAVAGQCACPLG